MRRPTGTRLPTVLVVAALLVALPGPVASQADRVASAIGGVAVGAVAGVYVTTGIYVMKARFDSYIFSLHDLVRVRLETLPLVLMPVGLGTLGAVEPGRLWNGALWGLIGFVGGAGLGAGLGHALGDSSEATWAGGIIGSAFGTLIGLTAGALMHGGGSGSSGAVTVTVPIRAGWPR